MWTIFKKGTTSDVYINKKKSIIKKVFFSSKINFENELTCLKKLSGIIHFPKLIEYNKDELSITMTYCGKTIYKGNKPTNWKMQIDNILDTLKKNNITYHDFHIKNICIQGCTIYLIDFGSAIISNDYDKNEHLYQVIRKI